MKFYAKAVFADGHRKFKEFATLAEAYAQADAWVDEEARIVCTGPVS